MYATPLTRPHNAPRMVNSRPAGQCAIQHLQEVFSTPPKSRSLEIANKIKRAETGRQQALCRIIKTKQQLREIAD